MASPEVDIGRGEVAETFVISATITMIDEGCDLCLKVLREVVVFEQDAVLEGLVSLLDLALGSGDGPACRAPVRWIAVPANRQGRQ